ncbi:hypothetical protein FA09DRAFT_212718 [Tilletiopsis washingtonensis]|jgi:hypothetical protein|uniref:Uncharacterized protein n=1 Tax=Tilletiopsis washingtonensis TaxID=58919 RepID=A0A316ZH43_9BASI|nr:hypothetical protein FA09DRAFT_212718 [Tilletiopsis washingtonensis]PWN99605.1 hypothetical protein FA09DRAFT_212718 [Tilletiopsis washingtonensis]
MCSPPLPSTRSPERRIPRSLILALALHVLVALSAAAASTVLAACARLASPSPRRALAPLAHQPTSASAPFSASRPGGPLQPRRRSWRSHREWTLEAGLRICRGAQRDGEDAGQCGLGSGAEDVTRRGCSSSALHLHLAGRCVCLCMLCSTQTQRSRDGDACSELRSAGRPGVRRTTCSRARALSGAVAQRAACGGWGMSRALRPCLIFGSVPQPPRSLPQQPAADAGRPLPCRLGVPRSEDARDRRPRSRRQISTRLAAAAARAGLARAAGAVDACDADGPRRWHAKTAPVRSLAGAVTAELASRACRGLRRG